MTSTMELNLGELLPRAWELFVRNAAAFVGAVIVAGLIMVVAWNLAWYIHPRLADVVNVLLAGPFLLGYYRMALAAVRGQAVTFGMIFEGFQNAIQAMLANLLVSIFFAAGFMCLIIGGVAVYALYITTFLFMADGHTNFWDAMESSRKLTMRNYLPWFLLALVVLVLHAAGAALCGFGLLVAAPVGALMVALTYEQQRHPAPAPASGEIDLSK